MQSKGRKFLFGCAIGCGGLLLLGVGSCVGFTIWIDQRGELLEPRQLFGPATAGYVEWTLSADDPGSKEFVTHMFERGQSESGTANVPAIFRTVIERGQAKNRESVQELLPVVVAWMMEPGEFGGDDRHLLSFSIERLGNRLTFMDWSLGLMARFSPDIETVGHAGERLYVVTENDRGVTFFIHEQDLFVTTDVETGKQAVDRLREPAPERVASELGDIFAALPESALRGAVSNASGSLAGVWEILAGAREDQLREPLDWRAIRAVTLSGGLSGPQSFEGVLELHCKDAEWAAANGESFVKALRADYRRAHLPFETDVTTVGDRIRVVLRLDDVPGFLDEL